MAWFLAGVGGFFLAYGVRLLVDPEVEPSWISVLIVPGSSAMVLLGIVGLLLPGFFE